MGYKLKVAVTVLLNNNCSSISWADFIGIFQNFSFLSFPLHKPHVLCFFSDMKVARQNYREVSDFLELGLCNFRPLDIFQILEIIRKANEFRNKMLHWSI